MDKGFAVLKIDPEFKTLIWPLRKEEYLQLEVNLTIDGCRDPIITCLFGSYLVLRKSVEQALLATAIYRRVPV